MKNFYWYKLNPVWQYKYLLNRLHFLLVDLTEYYDVNGVSVYYDDAESPETVYIPAKCVLGLDYNQIAYIALTKAFGGDIDDVMYDSDEKSVSKVIQNAVDSIKREIVNLNMGDDTYTKFFKNKRKNVDCYIVDVTL